MIALLVENTITAAVLAVLVLALCRCFRIAPPARHALWLLVVLRLLSPVGLLWSVPLPLPMPRFLGELTHSRTSLAAAEKGPRRSAPSPRPPASEQRDHVLTLMLDGDERSETATAAASEPDGGPGPAAGLDLESAGWAGQDSGVDSEFTEPEGLNPDFLLGLELVWLAGATIMAGCYARRTWRFARYARSGKPAAPSLAREVEELAGRLGVRSPRVRVLANLPSPVVWCFRHPVLLWPKGLQDRVTPAGRRGVLVHELAHLRRRDHWVRWLEMAAAVLHWWNPLFWFVRRQLRLHAELACDAWVTGSFPDIRRDYAEALLEVCARFHRAAAPSPAVGVGGDGRSDFRRRLTMIMCEPAPCRLAAGAKLFLVLVLLTALPAWTLGQGQKPPRNESKPPAVKEVDLAPIEILEVAVEAGQTDVDADAVKKMKDLEARIADLTKQLQALKAAKGRKNLVPLHVRFPDARDADKVRVITVTPDGKVIESKGEAAKKDYIIQKWQPELPKAGQPVRVEIRETERRLPVGQYKVIGPDGKEIKGAKVIIVEPVSGAQSPPGGAIKADSGKLYVQPTVAGHLVELARSPAVPGQPGGKPITLVNVVSGASGQVINLSRATYRLPKEKSAALAAFLKENVKAAVLEIKVEDSGLTVTTTPEAQAVIGGIARMMAQGQNRSIQTRPGRPENQIK